jgi:hypothetical protein
VIDCKEELRTSNVGEIALELIERPSPLPLQNVQNVRFNSEAFSFDAVIDSGL